jgi:hypothetical protein
LRHETLHGDIEPVSPSECHTPCAEFIVADELGFFIGFFH